VPQPPPSPPDASVFGSAAPRASSASRVQRFVDAARWRLSRVAVLLGPSRGSRVATLRSPGSAERLRPRRRDLRRRGFRCSGTPLRGEPDRQDLGEVGRRLSVGRAGVRGCLLQVPARCRWPPVLAGAHCESIRLVCQLEHLRVACSDTLGEVLHGSRLREDALRVADPTAARRTISERVANQGHFFAPSAPHHDKPHLGLDFVLDIGRLRRCTWCARNSSSSTCSRNPSRPQCPHRVSAMEAPYPPTLGATRFETAGSGRCHEELRRRCSRFSRKAALTSAADSALRLVLSEHLRFG
jgi:hypothetical protein